jgi:hypothetical protein
MKKAIVNLLFLIGIFLFFFSREAGGFFIAMGIVAILIIIAERKAEILDNWSALIRGAQGQRDKVISTTKELINISKAPSIEMKEEKVGSGLAPTTFGETREFLIVADRRNLKLGNFKTYVNANDYGDGLFVSWYLTFMPDVWQVLASLIPGARKVVGLDELNLFNKQDLTAYVTCVHHCLLEAVDKLMLELNQDPSKIDRKTRGFLGIS